VVQKVGFSTLTLLQRGDGGSTVSYGDNMANLATVELLSCLLQAEAISSTRLQDQWLLLCDDFNSWVVAIGYEGRRGAASTGVLQNLTLSSHLSKAVSTLLNAIISLLTDLKATAHETDSQDHDYGASSDDDNASEEKRFELVEESISDLHALVPALLNPAPHDALNDTIYASISISQTFDQNHVDAKFPDAEVVLRQRLSRLNWSRRVLRTSSRLKAEQPRQAIPDPAPLERFEQSSAAIPPSIRSPPSVAADTTTLPPQTVLSTDPSTFQSAQSLFEPPPRDLDLQSSLGSMTSYAATTRSTDDKTIPVPHPPNGCLEGLPFQCTICFREIRDVKSKKGWKRHVFRDLKPYVCTFGGCRTRDVMYASRSEWFEHEIKVHRGRLLCFPPCQRFFETQDEFHPHLRDYHFADISVEQRRLLCDLRWSRTLSDEPVECPLCKETFAMPARLEKHLGGHLEQIALFTLPSQDRADDDIDSSGDDDDDSEDNDEEQSTGGAIVSDLEMDFSEKMSLFDRPDPSTRADGGTEPVSVPDHVVQGLPYCRTAGKPAVLWDPRTWVPERPFICTSQCGETFDTRLKWLAHEHLNFPKAWWVCKLCSEGFPRRDRLRDHKKTAHGDWNIVTTERRGVPFPVDFSQRCTFGCRNVFFNDLSTCLDHFQGHVRSSVAELREKQKQESMSSQSRTAKDISSRQISYTSGAVAVQQTQQNPKELRTTQSGWVSKNPYAVNPFYYDYGGSFFDEGPY
jgi:hypothetical protein